MDSSAITALAALMGATIGGLTSFLASWFSQRTQARAQLVAQDTVQRQELYKEFIEEAARCYVHALQHDEPDIPGLVGLYAKIARMRVLSSPAVVDVAERIAHRIADAYLEPDKTFLELREMVNDRSIDMLGDFSQACRTEFESRRSQYF